MPAPARLGAAPLRPSPSGALHGQDAAVAAAGLRGARVADEQRLGAARDVGAVLLADQRRQQLGERRRQDRAHPLGTAHALQAGRDASVCGVQWASAGNWGA